MSLLSEIRYPFEDVEAVREQELYDIALRATDGVLGAGTYAEMNKHNPDPGVQAAIERSR